MAEENQNNSPVDPANLSVKRKRGRPRKDDVPGSESVKRRPYRKAEQAGQFGDISVGQTVSGVLDGKFDAGYMLTVTVGNSGSVLTGVVFDQGRSVPISAANDVAPNVEMLKRVTVPIPSSGRQSQSIPRRNEVTVHSTESTIRSMPEDLNMRHPIGSLVQNTKVQIDHNPVSSNASEVVHSDLSLKSPSNASFHDADGHTNLNTINAPQSSASGTKEIQATMSSDKQLVQLEGTTKSSQTGTRATVSSDKLLQLDGTTKTSQTKALPAVAAQTLASEPMNMKTLELDDKPVLTKEQKVDPIITPQVAIQDPENEKEGTLDLLGEKAAPFETVEPPVELANCKSVDNILTGNMAAEETKASLEQNTDIISQDLDTQSQPTIQSHAPELKPQNFPSEPVLVRLRSGGATPSCGDKQPSDATESS